MLFAWQAQYKRHSPSDMLRGQGADFLRGVGILEHQIFRFAKVILRDRV